MGKIGGNINSVIQMKCITEDDCGCEKNNWKPVLEKTGFLDLVSAETNRNLLLKKVSDADHVFLCDYFKPYAEGKKLTAENSRMIIDGEIYEVKLYDDPMGMHEHMEIYLSFLGGQG